MKQVLTDLARSIVNKPECVVVTERDDGDTVYLKLMVDENDLGKVIGKQGRSPKRSAPSCVPLPTVRINASSWIFSKMTVKKNK